MHMYGFSCVKGYRTTTTIGPAKSSVNSAWPARFSARTAATPTVILLSTSSDYCYSEQRSRQNACNVLSCEDHFEIEYDVG